MDDNLEQQVRDLDRRLRRLEQQLSDDRKEHRRRRRQATLSRVGLLIVMGGAYVWYLMKVTSPL